MLLHVVPDEKFIDMALREFEAVAPCLNIAIFLGKKRSLRFVEDKSVLFASTSQARRLVRSPDIRAVIFHSLPARCGPILEVTPPGKPVFWLGYGYDYYDRLLSAAYPDGLLLPRTASLMKSAPPESPRAKAVRLAKTLVKALMDRTERLDQRTLKRVTYFIPVLESEHALARELNPWFTPGYVCWNYGTLEDDLCGVSGPAGPGEDILVGNSAAPENNHLEIFELLSGGFETAGRKIIVPLSYGNEWYADRVIEAGRRLFGDRFTPLTSFMPKGAYMDTLSSCGHVFMNHVRQQAFGNIAIMMLKGAKVYLSPVNPLSEWLRRKGAHVDDIDSARCHPRGARQRLVPLDEGARLANIQVISSHFGRDVQRARTRHLVEIALGS